MLTDENKRIKKAEKIYFPPKKKGNYITVVLMFERSWSDHK